MNRFYRMGLSMVLALFFLQGVGFAAGDYILTNKGGKVWDSNPKPNQTATWSGTVDAAGYVSGQGVLQWFRYGKPTEKFEGIMLQGKRFGKGILTWSDGGRYEGDFIDDNLTGKGVLTWGDGERYEGDFVDDQRTGQGVHIYGNGFRYEGSFSDGAPFGSGMLLNPDGSYYWKGEIKGRGCIEGSRYYRDGSIYVGEMAIYTPFPMRKGWDINTFMQFVPYGEGTLYGPNQEIVKQGHWEIGKFIGEK